MGETIIIKVGSMIKRSQNKKRWSIVNYKNRYFELSHTHLMYFDNCEGGEVRALIFFLVIYLFIYYLRNLLFTIKFILILFFYYFAFCLCESSIDRDFQRNRY